MSPNTNSQFYEFLIIFPIGCFAGWCLEFIYRSLFKKSHNIVNPGFLSGPYLPIYGFGAFILYLFGLSSLQLFIKLVLFTISATMLEFFVGFLFFNFFHLRLWDYSDRAGNIIGIVCPQFLLVWAAVGYIGLLFVFPALKDFVVYLKANVHYLFYFGIFYGAFLSDVGNSFNIATRLSSIIDELQEGEHRLAIDLRKIHLHLRENQKPLRSVLARFFLPLNVSRKDLENQVERFVANVRNGIRKRA